MRMLGRGTRALAALCLSAAVLTCGDATGPQLVPLGRIIVTPAVDSLFAGGSLALSLLLRDTTGRVVPARPLTWRSSDTAIATVNDSGVVHGRSAGTVAITAHEGDVEGGAFLTVQWRPVVLTMPDTLSLRFRQAVILLPVLRSASGTRIADRSLTWSSSDSAVAWIEPNGRLTAMKVGSAVVMVRAGELSDSTVVVVAPAPVARVDLALPLSYPYLPGGVMTAFVATVVDSLWAPSTHFPVTWSVSDTVRASIQPNGVGNGIGLFTGLRPGPVTIIAEAGGVADSLRVHVTFGPVAVHVEPETVVVAVNEQAVFSVTVYDPFGGMLDIVAPELTPLDTSVAHPTSDPHEVVGWRPGITAVALRTPTGLRDTAQLRVVSASAARLSFVPTAARVHAYTDGGLPLAYVDSGWHRATLRGPVQLVSSDTSVLRPVPALLDSVTPSTVVRLYARRPGVATLTAVSDSFRAVAGIAVTPLTGTLTVHITTRPPTLTIGDSVTLAATVTRWTGPWPYLEGWASSDPAVVSVTQGGLARAVGVGTARIRAWEGPHADSFTVMVRAPTGPVIATVQPAVVTPGATLAIRGTGFGTTPAAIGVTIEGRAAQVLAASDTLLTVAPPVLTCAPQHDAPLTVTHAGSVATDTIAVAPASLVQLGVGTVTALSPQVVPCFALLTSVGHPDPFLILTTNTADAPADLLALRIGTVAPPGGAAPAAGPAVPPPLFPGPAAVRLAMDSLRRVAGLHRRILDANAAMVRRTGAPVPLLRAARAAAPQRAVTATVNGIAHVRVPNVERPDFCSSYSRVGARLVYAGAHVALYEDTLAPLARTMDSVYREVGMEFDTLTWPALVSYFGDPLAMDQVLDGDGRVAFVFTPIVNRVGAAGFVVSCDFYPERNAPSSNTGELAYIFTPERRGAGYAGLTAEAWKWQVRSVLTHEAKHLAGYAQRMAAGLGPEEAWLEEGSAVLAEEVWTRAFHGSGWRGDVGYIPALYCEVRPTWPECASRPMALYGTFALLYDALREPHLHSPLGPVDWTDGTFYATGWSLLRWAADRTAVMSEQAFTRALVTHPLTGIAKLAAITGLDTAHVLSQWAIALWADNGLPMGADYSLRSYNLPDILAGMSSDFPQDFPPVFPQNLFTPLQSAGVAGGASHYYRGVPPGTVVGVRMADGRPIPATVRVTVVRLP